MYHRKKHRRKSGQVDLNLAAMLDMAFQLLAFFILTFKPAPVEGQLGMHLPPPIPITNTVKKDKTESSGTGGGDIEDVEKLDLFIKSSSSGDVSQVKVGMRPIIQGKLNAEAVATLKRTLKEIFVVQAIPFDRIQLVVDDKLRYEELMKIIDVCTQQTLPDGKKMQRISFIAASQ